MMNLIVCNYTCIIFFSTYGPSLGVMYYNNLGVIHLGLGKPTVACLYLQKALQESQLTEATASTSQSGKSLLLLIYVHQMYCIDLNNGIRYIYHTSLPN